MKDHYVTFAGYNAWANRRLYEAAALLSDAEYRADKGAFFKSMHGTLNHLLATDRIWIAYIASLDEERLRGVIRYRRVSTPEEFVQKLMPALDHWFNHQTHHRGHAHMILTSLGKTAPELDLLYYQREAQAGRA